MQISAMRRKTKSNGNRPQPLILASYPKLSGPLSVII